MWSTTGPSFPQVSTASSFRLFAPARAPKTPSTRPSAGKSSSARASGRGLGRDRAGIGRPTTRYFGGSRPSSSYARKTRRAKGAASRLASPRCASASVTAAGIRIEAAASTIGPATKLPAPSTTSGRRRRRILRLSRKAPPARRSERASSTPGRLGSAATRKPSNSNPASATRRASTRSGDPANVTVAPRSRSASPTAIAGSTCPAVPPAAIRHTGPGCSAMVASDVKEDSDAGESDDEARPSVGDEGEGDPCQRRDAHDGCDVDQRLPGDEGRDTGGEPFSEWVLAGQRDSEARVGEARVGSDQSRGSHQAELLADDGEDHVRVRFGKIGVLPDALPQPRAEDSTRAEAEHRLHGLVPAALRVVPRVEEAQEPSPPVGLEPGGGEDERDRETAGGREQAAGRAGHDEDAGDHEHDRDRGSQIRLDQEEDAENAHHEADRLEELAESARGRVPRQVRRHPDEQRQLRELGGLEDRGAELQPTLGPVDLGADRKHDDEQPQADDEQGRRQRTQRAEAEPAGEHQQHHADEGVEALLAEVVRRVTVAERRLPGGCAEDHHEPEGDERERDQEQELLLEDALLHRSSSTRRRNSSPRSSKSRNWS